MLVSIIFTSRRPVTSKATAMVLHLPWALTCDCGEQPGETTATAAVVYNPLAGVDGGGVAWLPRLVAVRLPLASFGLTWRLVPQAWGTPWLRPTGLTAKGLGAPQGPSVTSLRERCNLHFQPTLPGIWGKRGSWGAEGCGECAWGGWVWAQSWSRRATCDAKAVPHGRAVFSQSSGWAAAPSVGGWPPPRGRNRSPPAALRQKATLGASTPGGSARELRPL